MAKALRNKGITLGQMGKNEEEIRVYDEVVSRFGDSTDLALREQVAKALKNKGVTFRQMGKNEEEIRVYDDVVARFGDPTDLALREQVANALTALWHDRHASLGAQPHDRGGSCVVAGRTTAGVRP